MIVTGLRRRVGRRQGIEPGLAQQALPLRRGALPAAGCDQHVEVAHQPLLQSLVGAGDDFRQDELDQQKAALGRENGPAAAQNLDRLLVRVAVQHAFSERERPRRAERAPASRPPRNRISRRTPRPAGGRPPWRRLRAGRRACRARWARRRESPRSERRRRSRGRPLRDAARSPTRGRSACSLPRAPCPSRRGRFAALRGLPPSAGGAPSGRRLAAVFPSRTHSASRPQSSASRSAQKMTAAHSELRSSLRSGRPRSVRRKKPGRVSSAMPKLARARSRRRRAAGSARAGGGQPFHGTLVPAESVGDAQPRGGAERAAAEVAHRHRRQGHASPPPDKESISP